MAGAKVKLKPRVRKTRPDRAAHLRPHPARKCKEESREETEDCDAHTSPSPAPPLQCLCADGRAARQQFLRSQWCDDGEWSISTEESFRDLSRPCSAWQWWRGLRQSHLPLAFRALRAPARFRSSRLKRREDGVGWIRAYGSLQTSSEITLRPAASGRNATGTCDGPY